jgi:hypothetical protein
MTHKRMLKSEILKIVDNQVSDGDPPETKQTYERLLSEGFSKKETREMIGTALIIEIWHMMKDKEPFNRQRYAADLDRLPEDISDE